MVQEDITLEAVIEVTSHITENDSLNTGRNKGYDSDT
ncbi:hypothetical protein KGM_200430 [Danaus plexippus plexippus]|uniref:Uncharacterized protein n=1 Tax=Danaus plexippus plexippus TaxID=278856 RepID=A0A212EPS5_DANPL|nr:hypothetical protein KGM_200430 [Danaus plexippus plexippus]